MRKIYSGLQWAKPEFRLTPIGGCQTTNSRKGRIEPYKKPTKEAQFSI
jgi:hypothetical protein